jgi:hypothetical protein
LIVTGCASGAHPPNKRCHFGDTTLSQYLWVNHFKELSWAGLLAQDARYIPEWDRKGIPGLYDLGACCSRPWGRRYDQRWVGRIEPSKSRGIINLVSCSSHRRPEKILYCGSSKSVGGKLATTS